MALSDELRTQVTSILRDQWVTTAGRVVPDPTSVGFGNRAVELENATVLYADIDGSTVMVDSIDWRVCAEAYKTFLLCAAKIIKAQGGAVTAYDGDRIMGIFVGDRPNSRATTAGLKIYWAVRNIINPAIAAQYTASTFQLRHTVGIDTSTLRAARTGVRGDNDLVWIGRAANYAAKLTSLPSEFPTWITESVFNKLAADVKHHEGQSMWEARQWTARNNLRVYRSSWMWEP